MRIPREQLVEEYRKMNHKNLKETMVVMKLKKLMLITVLIYFCLISKFLCLLSFAEAPFNYNNSQILGMGGVSLVASENVTSFIDNPSHLAYLNKAKITSNIISLRRNNGILDFYELYKNSEMQDILNGDKNWEDASGELKDKMLAYHRANFQIASDVNFMYPLSSIGNFGIGIYGNIEGLVETDGGIFVPTGELNYIRDFLIVASFGKTYKLPFLESYLKPFGFGINLKYLQRQKVNDLRTLVEYKEFSFNRLLRKGWGLGVDFGLSYKILSDKLAFALVWKDCGNTTLKWDSRDSTPILSRVNFGIAYQPERIYYWKNKYVPVNNNLVLACNLNEIGIYEDFYKRLHLGMSFSFWNILLSTGFNQGYATAGLGLKLGRVTLDYAYYGVERGIFAGQDVDWNQIFSISVAY